MDSQSIQIQIPESKIKSPISHRPTSIIKEGGNKKTGSDYILKKKKEKKKIQKMPFSKIEKIEISDISKKLAEKDKRVIKNPRILKLEL